MYCDNFYYVHILLRYVTLRYVRLFLFAVNFAGNSDNKWIIIILLQISIYIFDMISRGKRSFEDPFYILVIFPHNYPYLHTCSRWLRVWSVNWLMKRRMTELQFERRTSLMLVSHYSLINWLNYPCVCAIKDNDQES